MYVFDICVHSCLCTCVQVPLPFGVRTVTTPRGTHNIKQLEQLEDGACYLCSDRRQAKPINMELAGKRPAVWHHHGRRPHRPDGPPAASAAPTHHPAHRQRRVLLVKNSDPGVRRSVVLGRRSTHSLRAFLEEVSELMQCHIRKLYTMEGRKVRHRRPGVRFVCVCVECVFCLPAKFVSGSMCAMFFI